MIWINGRDEARLSALDRGLLYGDGVFRTLRLTAGQPVAWDAQYRQLMRDCAALNLPCPSGESLLQALRAGAPAGETVVGKIIVTRGSAGRGYAMPEQATPTVIVQILPFPSHIPLWRSHGVRVICCGLRLSAQPLLAGIKHLNRLENVLARSEWNNPAIAEGLLFDEQDCLIEGTSSNVFLRIDGRLVTPELSRCGVAGMQRSRIIDLARQGRHPLEIRPVTRDELARAEDIVLTNSLIDAWQVIEIDGVECGCSGLAQQLRNWLEDAI